MPHNLFTRALDRFHTLPQPVRYLVTGGSGVAVGYLTYAGLVLLGMGPVAALAIGNALSAVAAYFFHRHGVFQNSQGNRLGFYLLTALVFYLINAAALKGLLYLGVPPLLAQLGLLPFIVGLSFLSTKYLVFKDR